MRLARWRREAGLTQQQLADMLGCTQPYVSTLERAQEPALPTRELAARIYRVTRCAVDGNDLYFPDGLPDLRTAELPFGDASAPLLDSIGSEQPGDGEGETAELASAMQAAA